MFLGLMLDFEFSFDRGQKKYEKEKTQILYNA